MATLKKETPKATGPKLITDKAELTKAIDSIATRGKKLDADVQLAGLSALNHLDKHGDTAFVNRLYLALAKGARRRALAEWFMAYGKVSPNANNETKKEQPFAYDKSKVTDLEGASIDPWYDFAPEPTVEAMFDLRKALHQMLNRASKAADVNDPELLGRLRELDTQLQAGHEVGPVEHAAAATE